MFLARLDDRLGERGGVRTGLRGRAHVVQPLDRIVLRRRVTTALLGEHVHDDRSVVFGRVAQRALETLDVVPVERSGVPDAEVLEERVGLEVFAERGDGGFETAPEPATEQRDIGERAVEASALTQIRRADAEARDALAEFRDRRRVRTTVVVEDDDGLTA